MPNEVKVNGVVLTRKQVEDALAELNAPPEFKGGELVIHTSNKQCLVLDPKGWATGHLDKAYFGLRQDYIWVVSTHDGQVRYMPKSEFEYAK
jgi:hypothetical protein